MSTPEFDWDECLGSWFAPPPPEATRSHVCHLEGKDEGEEWLMLFVHFERDGERGWFFRGYDDNERVVNSDFFRTREEAKRKAEEWYPAYKQSLLSAAMPG